MFGGSTAESWTPHEALPAADVQDAPPVGPVALCLDGLRRRPGRRLGPLGPDHQPERRGRVPGSPAGRGVGSGPHRSGHEPDPAGEPLSRSARHPGRPGSLARLPAGCGGQGIGFLAPGGDGHRSPCSGFAGQSEAAGPGEGVRGIDPTRLDGRDSRTGPGPGLVGGRIDRGFLRPAGGPPGHRRPGGLRSSHDPGRSQAGGHGHLPGPGPAGPAGRVARDPCRGGG